MAIIRTTYSQRLAQLRTNNMRLGRDLARAQEEASTGLRVSRASDDAGLTTRLAQLREQQDDQQVYADNAEWAMGVLDVADGALTDLAGAEPAPCAGSQKFVQRFPHAVLHSFITPSSNGRGRLSSSTV